jgi:hypothetical protein
LIFPFLGSLSLSLNLFLFFLVFPQKWNVLVLLLFCYIFSVPLMYFIDLLVPYFEKHCITTFVYPRGAGDFTPLLRLTFYIFPTLGFPKVRSLCVCVWCINS